MLEKGKISSFEMGLIMHPTIISTGILIVPSVTGKVAGKDMWLSPIWASIAGFIAILLAIALNKQYPKQTIVEYSEEILGRVLGKAVGIFIAIFYLHMNGIVLREYVEFVSGNFLLETPIFVIVGGMAFLCAMVVRAGLEVMVRTAVVFFPIVLLLLLLTVGLLLPDLEAKNIMPFMKDGIVPSIKGAYHPFSWFSEFFLITFILPFLSDRDKALKWGSISVFLVMLMMSMTNLFSVLLFADMTSSFIYPVMSAAEYVSIADFIEHIESMVMALWVIGVFLKVSMFHYATVLGFAQSFQLQDYRPLSLPLGLLLVGCSVWSISSLQELTDLLPVISFHLIMGQIFLPLVLLILSFIRKKRRKKSSA